MGVNTNSTVVLDKALTKDNYLTFAEAQSDIEVSGMVSGDAKQGDTVTVTIDDSQYVAVVGADYTFTVSIPGNTLANSKNKVLTASLETTDLDGNVAVATDSATFGAYQASVSSATLLNNDDETTSNPGWAINLDEATIEDTTVTLSINDALHSANYGRDYSGVMQVFSLSGELLTEVTLGKENKFKADITIPAGEEGVAVYAVTNDDSSYTGDETIVIRVLTENGWLNSETAIISDESDKPTVASVSDSIVNEGGQAEFTFTLSNPSDFDTKVLVSPQADNSDIDFDNLWVDLGKGWAQANGEVTSDGTWITVPSSVKEVKLRVDVVEDSEVEGNEAFTVSVLAEGQSEPATGTITIVDVVATPPLVESITVLQEDVESGEAPAFQLNLTNAYSQDTEITLNVSDILHDVDFGKDYDGAIQIYSLAGELLDEINLGTQNAFKAVTNIPAGEESVVVRANLIDDNLYEGEESLIIRAAVSGKQGWVKSDAATITDETDTVTVAAVSDTTVFEGNSAELTVTMSNPSVANNTVFLTSSNSNDVDLENVSVNFGKGWVNASIDTNTNQISIDVPGSVTLFNVRFDTISDGIYEGNETFTISANVEGQTESASGNVTIKDIAGVPTVESILAVRDGIEGGDAPGFKVNMTSVSASDTTVTLNVVDSLHDVKYGLDYSGVFQIYSVSGEFLTEVTLSKDNKFKADITVPAGDDGVVVYVMTTDDTVYEGPESVVIRAAVSGKQGWVKSEAALITDENDNDDADRPLVDNITVVQEDMEGGKLPGYQVNMTNTSTTDTTFKLTLSDGLHSSGFFVDYTGVIQVYSLDGEFLEEVALSSANRFKADVTVPAGDSGVLVYVEGVNDDIYEGDETLVIRAGVLGQQGWVNSDAATITDEEDRPSVSSITFLNDGSEDGQAAGFTLNMSNVSTTSTTVQLHVNDALHQATIGEDYSGVMQIYSLDGKHLLQEVTLTSENGYLADITIPAWAEGVIIYAETLNDDVYEGNETIKIQGAVVGQQDWVQSDTATITDDADIPEVDSITWRENATEGNWVSWDLNMTNTSTTDTTIEVKFSDGAHQADFGSDYNGKIQVYTKDGTFLEEVDITGYKGVITVPAGQDGVIIYADTLNDDVYEGNESFTIMAGATHQDWVQSDTATITDEADLPEVDSVTRVQDAIEGGQWAIWTLNMTNTSTTDSIVELSFDDSLHQAGILNHGDDYVGQVNVHALDGTFLETVYMNIDNVYRTEITVPAGHEGVQLRAATMQDSVYEGNETLVIKAGAPHQAWVTSDTVVIIDEADLPEVASITWRENATEGNWVSWDLNMTNTSTTDTTIEVKFSDGAHQADFGSDYNGKVQVYTKDGTFLEEIDITGYKGAITVPAGQDGVIIYADTLNDDVYEGNESFTIMAGATHQDWVQSDTATITDEADLPEVDSVTREQDAIEGGQWAIWTLNMTNTSTTDSIVELSFDDSLHQAGILNHGDDYVGQVNVHALDGTFLETVYMNIDNVYRTEITVPAGHEGVEIRAATLDDSVYEGNETLIIKAGAPHQAWVVSEAAVIIDDADLPEVDSITLREDATEGNWVSWDLNMTNTSTTDTTIEVKFSDGAHQADFGSDYNGKIQVYTKGGTFLEEIDITGYKGAITVPAGQDGVIIYADTLNDDVYEGNESFTIMAGATHQDWVQSDTATITDEADLPEVDSVTRVQDAIEGGQWAIWTLNMTNTSTTDSIVELSFDDSLHQAGILNHGDDYVGQVNVHALDGTFLETVYMNIDNVYRTEITVPAGHEGVQLRAATMQDSVYEGNETLVIKAGAPHQAWVTSDAVVIIDDADLPEVDSVTRVRDAIEGDQWAAWTVNMTNTSTTDSIVELSFDDSLHQAGILNHGDDYVGQVNVHALDGTFLETVYMNIDNAYRTEITVPAGHAGVQLRAATMQDSVYEGNETLVIKAGAPHQPWVTSDAVVIIDDADIPEVDSVTRVQDAIEGGQWAIWTLNMTNTSTTDSIVELSFDDSLHQAGILNHGDDYVGQVNVHALDGTFLETVYMNIDNVYRTEITVPAGHEGVQLRAATMQDSVYEGNETLVIKAGAPHQAWVTSDTVVIIDEADLPEVASITWRENATEGNWVSWDLNMTNTSTTDTTIEVKFSDGAHQADFGSDYNGKIQVYTKGGTFLEEIDITGYKGAITVPAGQDGVIIYADTLNDDVYEGNESFTIMAGATHQDWVQSDNATITDESDKPTLSIVNTNGNNNVTESNWATFTIKLSNPVDQATKVKVNVYTGASPDVNNKDMGGYEYWTGSSWANFKSGSQLTFAAHQTELQVRAKPINDNKVEGNERLIVKAQPVVDETHIGDGEVQSAITVIDKGYRDTSNDTAGHIHWHIDGGGTQHVNGNGWRPHEIVTIYNPNGSSTVIYADKHGFFNINAENLYTVAGTLNAKGAQSGWAVGSKYVNPSVTPIVLDLDGDGIETSDVTENPVHFDYDGDGKDVKTGWIAGGDGLLVRDINKDGQINDGSELFGSNTQLADGSTAVDGYEALAQHDSNADGVIDKNDAIYAELGVWVDKDQDGETDEGELLSIDEANVASIELTATITSNESNNNTIGKSSSYTTMDGEERVAADVWFATQQGETEEANTSNLIETHSISGLDSDELTWHSEDVASQPWSDTVTDFTIGEPPLDLSDLVTDGDDNLLSEDDVDMYEQDGSTVLRVDTNGDHVWNQEIILQDVSLDDIVDENGIIKNGVFGDDNVKALFQKASSSLDVSESTHTHLEDPKIEDH
ncbi:Calx-beta domain-containing protein [Enterovibrio norvegicus]|uniref:Calx-beta domain-containing protein n=1 Tax=Enterovibrio norvegicus TaxID=188144 RepID=UPI0024B0F8A4|nr:Calx-beta domain-containing protein [Enterovibrio norvegicus]